MQHHWAVLPTADGEEDAQIKQPVDVDGDVDVDLGIVAAAPDDADACKQWQNSHSAVVRLAAVAWDRTDETKLCLGQPDAHSQSRLVPNWTDAHGAQVAAGACLRRFGLPTDGVDRVLGVDERTHARSQQSCSASYWNPGVHTEVLHVAEVVHKATEVQGLQHEPLRSKTAAADASDFQALQIDHQFDLELLCTGLWSLANGRPPEEGPDTWWAERPDEAVDGRTLRKLVAADADETEDRKVADAVEDTGMKESVAGRFLLSACTDGPSDHVLQTLRRQERFPKELMNGVALE